MQQANRENKILRSLAFKWHKGLCDGWEKTIKDVDEIQ